MIIVVPSPAPPALVARALSQLRTMRSGNTAAAALDQPSELARPWLPATCGNELRGHLWLWCDDVVGWLNQAYAWRSAQLIPACWPAHPHLAHEIPVLACQRVQAEESAGSDLLEQWHRQALPLFLDRMSARLGDSCRAGGHTDWPAAARAELAHAEASVAARQDRYHLDTHPPAHARTPAESE